MSKLHIHVDPNKCTGDASCVDIAPQVFQLDKNDLAVVKDPQGAARDTILEAARACPTEAISVVDEETGEQLAP